MPDMLQKKTASKYALAMGCFGNETSAEVL
jgi:hypothetical protein